MRRRDNKVSVPAARAFRALLSEMASRGTNALRLLITRERRSRADVHQVENRRVHGLTRMSKTSRSVLRGKAGLIGLVVFGCQLPTTLASASPAGDECRKQICNSAVSSCLRADLVLVPMARTEAEKQAYCTTFFNGCMTREITPDLPWYSPEMAARFLQCPP